jgi:hypothetical protein
LNIKDLLNNVDKIEGWLTSNELKGLFYIPQQIDHILGSIVEIGSFKGKSTITLGLGSKLLTKKKRSIYAIDPFGPHYDSSEYPDFTAFNNNYFDLFWENIKLFELENYVKPIRKFSTEAYNECPASIAALFIDGDHRYESVKHDIHHYVPRVTIGGLIAFHDYGNPDIPGVEKAVNELMLNKQFVHFSDYDHLRILKKLQ